MSYGPAGRAVVAPFAFRSSSKDTIKHQQRFQAIRACTPTNSGPFVSTFRATWLQCAQVHHLGVILPSFLQDRMKLYEGWRFAAPEGPLFLCGFCVDLQEQKSQEVSVRHQSGFMLTRLRFGFVKAPQGSQHGRHVRHFTFWDHQPVRASLFQLQAPKRISTVSLLPAVS